LEHFTIDAGRFVADCHADKLGREHFMSVLGYLRDFMAGQMFLISLSSGTLFEFTPQTVSCDDGPDEEIVVGLQELSAKFPLLQMNGPRQTEQMSGSGRIDFNSFAQLLGIARDPGLIVAIRNFQLALTSGGDRVTPCVMAIEAMRNSVFGRDPPTRRIADEAWALFRSTLSLSPKYLQECTEASGLLRHGSSGVILPEVSSMVLERTTEVFHRFFCFKLRGAPLSPPEFPEL
jgi:hypothetical protein